MELQQRVDQLEAALADIKRCNGMGLDGSQGCGHCYRVASAALDAD